MAIALPLLLSLLLVAGLADNVTIAIIGTNDIHGAAFPAQLVRSDNMSQQYLYGGLQYMGRLIQIIQSEYQGNVLYLDAGDQFQGGIESSKLVSSGKIMNDFYDAVDLNASAIGNHEFDFGPNFLLPFMSSKQAPSLAANIRSEKGQDVFLPNQ
jgi:5'-nucleotidase/UDP-sugar diphosphatase